MFLCRTLKALNFQPKIALVTRTLANAFEDLAHFFILFMLVTLAYGLSGVVLFGHQYEGYSTLTNSIFNNLVMLLSWNMGDLWVQVRFLLPLSLL